MPYHARSVVRDVENAMLEMLSFASTSPDADGARNAELGCQKTRKRHVVPADLSSARSWRDTLMKR